MKTIQDYFDTAYRYFVFDKNPKATTPSATDVGACAYRGNKSNCAIGCQLPDKLYNPNFEGRVIKELFDNYPTIEEFFGANNLSFLAALQIAHDTAIEEKFLDYVTNNFQTLASRYNLTIPTE